jgi:hypothetical protein
MSYEINTTLIKLVRLFKIYLIETYDKVCLGKYLSVNFPIQNGLKHGDVLSPHFSTLFYNKA